MRTGAYLERLKADLARWTQAGHIDAALADTLFADASAHAQRARASRSSPILPGLAALALVLGVLTVIAANWSGFNGVMRLALLFSLLALTVFGAGELQARKISVSANMLATLAAALFGGGLVIIGQLYHVSASNSAFFAAWAFGASAVALLLRAPLAAAGALLLSVFWVFEHSSEFQWWRQPEDSRGLFEPIWVLALWAIVTLQAVSMRSIALAYVAAIATVIGLWANIAFNWPHSFFRWRLSCRSGPPSPGARMLTARSASFIF